MCPPFFFSMSLIPSYEWPEAKCLSFFSIVVISLDTKNKVLKVFCIWLHTWRKESFHQIVSLYYLKKLTRQIIVKRLTLLVKKDLTHIGIITKLCIMQLFGWHAWMFKMSVSSCYMFVSVFKISSKSSMLSTSNISSDVRGAKQWKHDATLPLYFEDDYL